MHEYADLELSLYRHEGGTYGVDFRFTQPDSEVDTGLGQASHVQAQIDPQAREFSPWDMDTGRYGGALTDALFSDPALRQAFAQAIASAQAQDLPLRIRLWISSSASELHNLRWELLCNPQDGSPLAMDEKVFLSRYLSSSDWRPVRLRARGNLRALVAVANPANLEEYNLTPIYVEAETGRIRAGLAEFETQYLPDETRHATLENILAQLHKDIDILILVAHGAMVKGRPVLYLLDEAGRAAPTYADEFAARIKELSQAPRLAILISCQSAGTGTGEALAALGPRLVEAGIPAVLAMQDNLGMDTAAIFLPAFFQALQEDGQIDRALTIARGAIRKQPDFWVPALFMRLKSGRLWYRPGFSSQSSSPGFETEVRYIHRGRCTPIIGPGLIESLVGPSRDMALAWADTFNYPMDPDDRDALPKVAQYLSTDKGESVPFDEYEDYIRNVLSLSSAGKAGGLPQGSGSSRDGLDTLAEALGSQRRAANPSDAYRVLAKLPFPIYIVATPDRLLEDALEEENRKPEAILSPWNARLAQKKTVFDLRPEYEPSPENPLVFYLFGRWNDRHSMVLTEDEYLRYLIGFTGNKGFVPEQVRLALSDTLLLFLGFQTEDWAFRVIFHSILAQAGSGLLSQYAHIAAQIEPEDERTMEPLRARRYLEKYFIKGANINIFWGRAEEYLAGLMRKWEARP